MRAWFSEPSVRQKMLVNMKGSEFMVSFCNLNLHVVLLGAFVAASCSTADPISGGRSSDGGGGADVGSSSGGQSGATGGSTGAGGSPQGAGGSPQVDASGTGTGGSAPGIDAGSGGANGDGGFVIGDPGTDGDGDFTAGPTYPTQPELTARGAPQGRGFQFTMDSTNS